MESGGIDGKNAAGSFFAFSAPLRVADAELSWTAVSLTSTRSRNRHDEKSVTDFGVEGGSVLHVSDGGGEIWLNVITRGLFSDLSPFLIFLACLSFVHSWSWPCVVAGEEPRTPRVESLGMSLT